MVVLMDPMEDPDDILRAHRSREKSYLFDVAFDFTATQVSGSMVWEEERPLHTLPCKGGFSGDPDPLFTQGSTFWNFAHLWKSTRTCVVSHLYICMA